MSIADIRRHSGKAAMDPMVPGATGEKPISPHVAVKTMDFSLIVDKVNFWMLVLPKLIDP